MEKNIESKLLAVQRDLRANKSQFNSFGNYKYRSCEDVLEAVKPLLAANALTLRLTDEIIQIGSRVYVKATAFLTSVDSGECVCVSAFAREEDTKKGMDASQVTGASSSYARKYALNGLFCIDDAKDSDATNTHEKEPAKETFTPTCKDCGKPLTDAEHDWSVKWYGMPLCREHQKGHEKIR